MHVKNVKLAAGGLFLALTVLAIRLGSVLETNTLFFLVLASYFTGVMYIEYKWKAALTLLLGGVVLGLLLTPDPFYVISYGCMGAYMIVTEIMGGSGKIKKTAVWIIRYVMYNIMLFAGLFFFKQLLLPGVKSTGLFAAVIIAAQAGPVIYEAGYRAFLKFWFERIKKAVR